MKKRTALLRTIAFIFFQVFWGNILNAQLPDGTKATTKYLNELLNNLSRENVLKFDQSSVDLSVTLSIAVYIVRDSNGNRNVDQGRIPQLLDTVNNYFKPVGIKFILRYVANVDDYHYSYFSMYRRPEELLTKHSTDKTINLYLVDSIQKDSVSYYGYTYFPVDTSDNYIFLRKNYFTGNYLACMLGHFFGLLSTHEKNAGVEMVNESNCATTGDLICDTYADPDINGLVNGKCLYTGRAKDTNGDFYVPSVANIMSNSRPGCRCIFTVQQYKRMYFYYKKFRQYLR
jgi:hypothetical protein